MLESLERTPDFSLGCRIEESRWGRSHPVEGVGYASQYLFHISVSKRRRHKPDNFPVGRIVIKIEKLQRVGVNIFPLVISDIQRIKNIFVEI